MTRPDRPVGNPPPAEFMVSAVRPDQMPPVDRPEIAFAGRSNVGKSSLLNRLLGRRKLARTGSTPGRTQTINFFDVGGRYYFVDLPGYGYAKVPMSVRKSWGPMVETYLASGRDLRLVIILVDVRREPQEDERNLMVWLDALGIEYLVTAVKADKLKRGAQKKAAEKIGREYGLARPPVLFSAQSGQGRDELWAAVVRACSGPGDAVEEGCDADGG